MVEDAAHNFIITRRGMAADPVTPPRWVVEVAAATVDPMTGEADTRMAVHDWYILIPEMRDQYEADRYAAQTIEVRLRSPAPVMQ
jgi:hypothetical protein